jgi:hypothetical protein
VSGVFQNIIDFWKTLAIGLASYNNLSMGWGVNILEDARHRIGLLQYNLFRVQSIVLFLFCVLFFCRLGTKKKTIVGFLVFNSSMGLSIPFLLQRRQPERLFYYR